MTVPRISKTLPILAFMFLFGMCSAFSQQKPDPILITLMAELKSKFAKLEPAPQIKIPDDHAGKSLILRYQTRKYMIYPGNKTGRLGQKLVEREGPDNEGLILHVHVQPKGEINQAVVPQTLKRPYWRTDLNVYSVPNSDKQLYIALSYRDRTDKKLIEKITKIIATGKSDQSSTSAPKTN